MTLVLENSIITNPDTDAVAIDLQPEDMPVRVDILTSEATTVKIQVRTASGVYLPLFVDGVEWSITTSSGLSSAFLPHIALALGRNFFFYLDSTPTVSMEVGLQVERGTF